MTKSKYFCVSLSPDNARLMKDLKIKPTDAFKRGVLILIEEKKLKDIKEIVL